MRQAVFFGVVLCLGCGGDQSKEGEKNSPRLELKKGNNEKPARQQVKKEVENTPQKKAEPKKVYTREEFSKLVLGLSVDKVRENLGAPDRIEQPLGDPRFPNEPGFEGYWAYKEITVDPKTKKVDPFANVWIKNGRIYQITY
jgi:hypothetical protein